MHPSKQSIHILGAPLALGQPRSGVDIAPQSLRLGGLLSALHDLGLEVHDEGDLNFTDLLSMPVAADVVERAKNSTRAGACCKRIRDHVQAIAARNQFCLTLGGDHSIALGTISGMLAAHPDLSVIWVDAHADINTPQTSMSGNIHGMPLAGLLGCFQPPLAGFEWLKPMLQAQRVALVGIRSVDPAERILLKQTGVHVFTMTDIDRVGIGQVMQQALQKVDPHGQRPLHLSFDIDGIDPGVAPATGTVVRGGLTYREAHYIAEAVADTQRLISMDLVEINPRIGADESTANEVQVPVTSHDKGYPMRADADFTVELGIELIASALGKQIFA